VPPHVFADVPPTAVIAQEEIFGPVLAVMKARDLDEALTIANGVPYALTGGSIRAARSISSVSSASSASATCTSTARRPGDGRAAAVGGFKLSGSARRRAAGLLVAVPDSTDYHREHDAARLRADG